MSVSEIVLQGVVSPRLKFHFRIAGILKAFNTFRSIAQIIQTAWVDSLGLYPLNLAGIVYTHR